MEKKIRIFKSFEEQEKFSLVQMLQTTAKERFQSLFQLQQWTNLFHPQKDTGRRIIIKNGHLK